MQGSAGEVHPSLAAGKRHHLLTVVIEDYFQVGSFSALIPAAHWERFESRLRRGTEAVLQLLADGGHRATFFSCGWIADHHPEVLRSVVAAGHEVACQGYVQYAAHEISRDALALDLRRSREAVEQAIGRRVHGHRIGRRWLREHELWLLDEVRAAGFDYDSSICPLGRQFGGMKWQQLQRHELAGGPLVEVPVSSRPVLGWQVPVAGGNWFRQAPDAPAHRAARRWQAAHDAPLVSYFHTWEFDPEQPRIAGLSPLQRLRHYRNLHRMPQRLRGWLDGMASSTIAAHLQLDAQPLSAAAAVPPIDAKVAMPLRSATAARLPLTLVVPCYNEAPTLPYLARTLQRFERRHGALLALSFVFVDDGSRDETAALLQALADELPGRATVLRHPSNRGIAAALLTGFAACHTELVAVIDADCTFDPEQLPGMLALVDDGVDVVSASPAHAAGAMRNVPPWRAAMSLGAAALYRRVLRHRLTSYTSCFRVYRRGRVQDLVLSEPGFCGVAEILGRLDLAGCRIVEYPAVLETRVLGQSKIRVLRTVLDHLRLLARLAALRWFGRPLPARVHPWRAPAAAKVAS